jgi:hypothetical protein
MKTFFVNKSNAGIKNLSFFTENIQMTLVKSAPKKVLPKI